MSDKIDFKESEHMNDSSRVRQMSTHVVTPKERNGERLKESSQSGYFEGGVVDGEQDVGAVEGACVRSRARLIVRARS